MGGSGATLGEHPSRRKGRAGCGDQAEAAAVEDELLDESDDEELDDVLDEVSDPEEVSDEPLEELEPLDEELLDELPRLSFL